MFEALKFKRTGVQSGVPDLFIPIPNGTHHGLFIELKRVKGGKVSETQKEWMNFLRSQTYYCDVCYGFEAAKDLVLHYLGQTSLTA